MINAEDVRIILPVYGLGGPLFKKDGFDVEGPYIGRSLFMRALRKIYFLLKLPGRSIWYNRKNITDKKYIFIFTSLMTADYVKWVRKHNPESKIVVFYCDPADSISAVSPREFDGIDCCVWTCDRDDAEKYGIRYYSGGGYYKSVTVKKEKPEYDIFYVGKDKGRADEIEKLYSDFKVLGLNPYFHVIPERTLGLKTKPYYKKFMPYSKVAECLGKTRAILHLGKGCQNGITLRIQESLVFGIKLITDDPEIMSFDFYSPNNIFILGKDPIESLPAFLDGDFIKTDSSYYSHPYFEDMINEIFENP